MEFSIALTTEAFDPVTVTCSLLILLSVGRG